MKRLRIREGEYQANPLKSFCPTVSKTFLDEPFCVSENFGYRIMFCLRGLCLHFRSTFFFVWRYRKSSSGNSSVLCFRKLLVTKSFLDRNGSSIFSVAVFLSHSREKFHRVILQWFKNLVISKNFMDMGGGETSRFSVKNLLFHSAGKTRRAPLYCVTSFEYDISLCLKELCHDFLSVFFVSQYRKTRSGNLSCCVSENFR